MRPYSLDEHWDLLVLEYDARNLPLPRTYRQWYSDQIDFLKSELEKIASQTRTHEEEEQP